MEEDGMKMYKTGMEMQKYYIRALEEKRAYEVSVMREMGFKRMMVEAIKPVMKTTRMDYLLMMGICTGEYSRGSTSVCAQHRVSIYGAAS